MDTRALGDSLTRWATSEIKPSQRNPKSSILDGKLDLKNAPFRTVSWPYVLETSKATI